MKPLVIKKKLSQDTGASQKAPKSKTVEELRKEWLSSLNQSKQADKALLAKWRNNG